MHQWLINVHIQNAKRAPWLHTNPAEKKWIGSEARGQVVCQNYKSPEIEVLTACLTSHSRVMH